MAFRPELCKTMAGKYQVMNTAAAFGLTLPSGIRRVQAIGSQLMVVMDTPLPRHQWGVYRVLGRHVPSNCLADINYLFSTVFCLPFHSSPCLISRLPSSRRRMASTLRGTRRVREPVVHVSALYGVEHFTIVSHVPSLTVLEQSNMTSHSLMACSTHRTSSSPTATSVGAVLLPSWT